MNSPKCSGRPGGKFALQPGNDLLPFQAAAIDHTVRRFELGNLFGRVPGASQADRVHTDHVAGIAVDRHERRHIFDDACQAAEHGQTSHAAELMHGHVARNIGPIFDHDMAAERGVVGENRMLADDAIVGHVSADHQQIMIADNR